MELTSGIVCILDNYKRPAGTGFVVSTATENLIVTCAHVLGEPKPERVTVFFQVTGEQREVKVIERWWRSQEAEDVAILQIGSDLPQQVQPLPLGPATGTRGHTIHTFGFPEAGEVEGVFGYGIVLGLGAKTKAGQPLLQMRSSEITLGFSGAPIWDEVKQRVIGMVVIVATPDFSGKLGETAFAIPTEMLRTVCSSLCVTEICPYRNLDAFTEADTTFFFGRKRVVEEMVNSLRDEPRFLAVFGPSGSGKSSVVQAGLIPQLRQVAVPGSDRWEIIVTRPADRIFRKRLEILNQEVAVRRVLIIDQFEELFVTRPEAECQALLTQLAGALDEVPLLTIILTMRDDFYSSFVCYEAFARRLRQSLVNIPALLMYEEITDIIEKPAQVVGLHFEQGLAETIVKDILETVSHGPERKKAASSTVLPLLEFALTQLWERRRDGTLTYSAYKVIGGVAGGLAQWADQEIHKLDEQQRTIAKRIFTDLIHLGSEDHSLPESRQRRSLASLSRRDEEREVVQYVVSRLVDARLLVTSRDDRNNEETVEVIHEALLREWGQLIEWLREDRRFLMWHQRFKARFQEWLEIQTTDGNDQNIDRLLQGRDLSEAEDWLIDRAEDLNKEEQNFIHVSRNQQRQEELRWKDLYEKAEQQRQIAVARGLAAQSELLRNQYPHLLERSILLAIEAMQMYPCLEADQALRSGAAMLRRRVATLFHEDSVHNVVFSPDGGLLATVVWDKTTRIWEIPSGRQIITLSHKEKIHNLAFSPDGCLLATAGENSAEIWEIPSGHHLTSLCHGRVNGLAFSPDGNLLATTSPKGIAEVWEITNSHLLISLPHKDSVINAMFNLDGSLLVTTSGNAAEVWEIPSGHHHSSLPHGWNVQALAFSPNGRYLATASLDNTARIWKISTGRQHVSLSHKNAVIGVAFSPNGRLLATASEDYSAGIWQVSDGRRLAYLPHEYSVNRVAFSPDGSLLATASTDDTTGLWETTNDHRVATLFHKDRVQDAAFSRDGSLLATASYDNTVGVWEVPSGHHLVFLSHENAASAVAFSPDGRLLACASGETARIWEMPSGRLFASFPHKSDIHEVWFSPVGHLLATASESSVAVWDIANGRCLVSFGKRVSMLTFSPDGRFLATRSGKKAEVWEIASGRCLASFFTHHWRLSEIAFSPNGQFLATADAGVPGEVGPVQVWEIGSGRCVASLRGNDFVTFSPDGQLLATTNGGSVDVWEMPSGRHFLSIVPSEKFATTIVKFSPDGQLLATACHDDTAGIWEITSGHRIATMSHEGIINAITFNPDGRFLATASMDHTAGIRETTYGRQLVRVMHEDRVYDAVFDPNGVYFATTSEDKTTRVWRWRPEDLIADAQSRLTRNLTLAEWQLYMGDETYRKTCPVLSDEETLEEQ